MHQQPLCAYHSCRQRDASCRARAVSAQALPALLVDARQKAAVMIRSIYVLQQDLMPGKLQAKLQSARGSCPALQHGNRLSGI